GERSEDVPQRAALRLLGGMTMTAAPFDVEGDRVRCRPGDFRGHAERRAAGEQAGRVVGRGVDGCLERRRAQFPIGEALRGIDRLSVTPFPVREHFYHPRREEYCALYVLAG